MNTFTVPKLISFYCKKLVGKKKQWMVSNLYRCFCGREFVAALWNVRSGHTKSCGCLVKKNARDLFLRHGDCVNRIKSAEFTAWINMNERCYNPNRRDYKNYGGRGIGVCGPWRERFSNFLRDMGRKPQSEYSLDRIDNNGNYTPLNCRWATWKQQANNRRHPIATH